MLAAVLSVMAVACLYQAILSPRRLSLGLAKQSTMDGVEIQSQLTQAQTTWERLLFPLIASVSRHMQGGWTGMSETDLKRAGIDVERLGLAELMAIKVLAALAGLAIALSASALFPAAILLSPALAFLGFIAPSLVVRHRKSQRQEQILKELPDLVSLLRAFVSTGISMEQALHLISARPGDSLLSREVRNVLSDYGLGTPIDQALDGMAQRSGIDELETLAHALIQGKRQGSSMERILRDQEQVVRMQQRNRASALAARVSGKLVGILVMVYLPEFLVLIMIPLFYGIFLKAFN
jgi:tight adherence protein C